ncbi:glycosyl hydrolase family 61-domain-containing protein [Cladorrhinum samala]|uniref:lytic cellulose monooxygenase (C4-dehydrogenating) n=1 Tax=Cladorrhinum samala TaxID=585594 RepID=A0AAV9HWE8_9PEZI|nr:glycosyl hydrolase family 61-domain-containing protein [Cladorrhinum samala]
MSKSLLTALLLSGTALAHSHLAHILINGALYHGFDPTPGKANYPDRVGWSSSNIDDGFVSPRNYSTPEIICHLSGAPPKAHAPIRAGDRLHVQWNGWPQNHVGPVLSYLAPCKNTQDGCGSVDKTALRWTKIDDSAPVLIDPLSSDGGPPGSGRWATNVLIGQNNSWQVEIPSWVKPGPYVLRNEIIALHFAKDLDGAQNYPLCMNLWVEAPIAAPTRTFALDEHDARTFYKPTDPGILFGVNNGTPLSTYKVPGPTLHAGAKPVPHSLQLMSLSKSAGTPVAVTKATQTVKFTAAPAKREAEATEAPKMKGRYNRQG